MKFSKYNHLFYSRRYGHLIYNALSNSFAEIDDELYKLLTNCKKNYSLIELLDSDLLSILIKKKIIVNNDKDEYYNLKLKTLLSRFDKESLNLTILPTRDCNFHCNYCYEEDRPEIYTNNETVSNILNFIKSYKNVQNIYVTWYGGEPLMAFNTIELLTKKIIELEKNYSAGIITNGYLLSDNIIKKLPQLKIHNIQITLDGMEEYHDTKRKHKQNSKTFSTIIQNLDNLIKVNSKIKINIRCNIDEGKGENFHQLYFYLKNRYPENNQINLYPGFIEKLGENQRIVSSCYTDRNRKIEFFISQFEKYNIQNLSFFPLSNRNECMARSINSYMIDPEGFLFKCWNDVGDMKMTIGNVNKKEVINPNIHTRYLTAADQLENQDCIDCVHFPNCSGNCPYYRISSLYNDQKINLCDIRKGNLEKFLEIHYQIRKNLIESDDKKSLL